MAEYTPPFINSIVVDIGNDYTPPPNYSVSFDMDMDESGSMRAISGLTCLYTFVYDVVRNSFECLYSTALVTNSYFECLYNCNLISYYFSL